LEGGGSMNKVLLKVVILVILIISIISFCLFRYYEYSSKSFEDLLGTNESNITKVFMTDGNTGNFVETTDKDKIKELMDLVNDRYYKKSSNQEKRTGYSYYYDFYSGDKQIVRITGYGGGDSVSVNSTYYNVSKPIDRDSLTKWFNSLPVNVNK
jgi:hypothetical protein